MAKKTVAAPRTGLRYIGGGSYLPGLPARDLNGADLVEYAATIAEMEQAGTLGLLYEEVSSTTSATSTSSVAGVAEGEGVGDA